jgi:SAM-dependent methyltransferase
LFKYVQYFFYIAWNWNAWLAIFVICHEIIGEKKYNISTIGVDELHDLEDLGVDTSHASKYLPVDYFILEKLMNYIEIFNNNNGFLDLGCGKGRTLAVAAHYKFNPVFGLDFHPKLSKEAAQLTESLKERFPEIFFKVINNDAFYFEIPVTVSTIFLFNPFDEVIMSGVVGNILESMRIAPRVIRVLYANPVHKELFIEEGFREIFHIKKMTYLEGSVLELKPFNAS